jgi:broad specificity phosphatase PhoE
MPPQQILLIRHGEKPPPLGHPRGIKEDGTEDQHSLVVRGWQRAGALVPFFCEPRHAELRRPTAVYSPPVRGKEGDHGRPYQTVIPIAARLGVEVQCRHGLDDEPALAAEVLSCSGVVLISWEHKRIPKIANAILGDATTAPQTWPDDRFDVVWVLDLEPSGRYRFSQLPQLLLAGDKADVVPYG